MSDEPKPKAVNVLSPSVSPELARRMYHRMRLIRRFEETAAAMANADEIPGNTHECSGQEAVAVGVCEALRADDVVASTHRGHGHALAKGSDTGRVLAELMGREAGLNHGRGGSLHVADMSLGFFGANGIVGASVPMACGAALSFKYARTPRVAVAFFGDGGINQGVVLESMNLAAVWDLPVVFVIENNGYAISTPIASAAKGELWRRGEAFCIRSTIVDGMDVVAVRDAAVVAVARARSGLGPGLMECRTYRFSHHFSAEGMLNLTYRTDDEVAEWRERDPIERLARELTRAGMWTDRATADEAVERELAGALEFARASPLPNSDTAFDYAYATPCAGMPARGDQQ